MVRVASTGRKLRWTFSSYGFRRWLSVLCVFSRSVYFGRDTDRRGQDLCPCGVNSTRQTNLLCTATMALRSLALQKKKHHCDALDIRGDRETLLFKRRICRLVVCIVVCWRLWHGTIFFCGRLSKHVVRKPACVLLKNSIHCVSVGVSRWTLLFSSRQDRKEFYFGVLFNEFGSLKTLGTGGMVAMVPIATFQQRHRRWRGHWKWYIRYRCNMMLVIMRMSLLSRIMSSRYGSSVCSLT